MINSFNSSSLSLLIDFRTACPAILRNNGWTSATYAGLDVPGEGEREEEVVKEEVVKEAQSG